MFHLLAQYRRPGPWGCREGHTTAQQLTTLQQHGHRGAALLGSMSSVGGRLERGLTLARTNKVYDTTITMNKVVSKVKGRASPFYLVGCEWDVLTKIQAYVRSPFSRLGLFTVAFVCGF